MMIKKFADLVQLPTAATIFLEKSFHALIQQKEALELLLDAMDDYFYGEEVVCSKKLQAAAKVSGLHQYVVNILFLILCAKPLHYIYKQKGLSDKIYSDSMRDLKYKLLECQKVYGIWGTFVFEWFRGFYLCERFQFGRLQYEKILFPYDTYGKQIKKGDTVYNCHIPSCGPLSPESVLKSLKEAYEFYKYELEDGILPVVCLSWLLYPPHFTIFPEDSNLRKFYEMFHIIDQYEEPANNDFWRIFGCEYNNNTQTWPETTTLQRNFKQYFLRGKCMGEGFGVLLFNGNEICG